MQASLLRRPSAYILLAIGEVSPPKVLLIDTVHSSYRIEGRISGRARTEGETSMEPRIRYVTSKDGVHIAFRVIGSGYPIIQLPSPLGSNLEIEWQHEEYRSWLEGLGKDFMVIQYDGRGSGLSDHDVTDLSMEAALADLDCVRSALNLSSFAIFARVAAGPLAIEYAARNAAVSHLMLWHAVPRSADFFDEPERVALKTLAQQNWELYSLTAASAYRSWSATENPRSDALILGSAGQQYYLKMMDAQRNYDASTSMPFVQARTLVMHRREYKGVSLEHSRMIACSIPGARLEILEGCSGLYTKDGEVLDAIRFFMYEDIPMASLPIEVDQVKNGAVSGLTAREGEVLRLVATGLSNAEVALRLGISVHTIERHLANVYEKWGVHSRVEVILQMLHRGTESEIRAW